MTIEKIENIMKKVDIKNIPMNNMKLFKDSLYFEKNRCESMETTEAKKLYESLLEIGEIIAELYPEAKRKYLEMIHDKKESYINCEIRCEEKKKQNNNIKKDIKNRNKLLRNINDKSERMNIFNKINRDEKIIKFNESSINILADISQAEIMTTFDIFNELSKRVDAVYSNNEFLDNKSISDNLIGIILKIVGMISTPIGFVISRENIIKAVLNMLEARDGEIQIINSINSVDKEIKKFKEKHDNMLVALLAIEIYINGEEYIYKVFDIEMED